MLSLPPLGDAEDLRSLRTGGCQLGKVGRPVQHMAGDLNPVVHEHRLHLRDHRPVDLEVRVAPVLRALCPPGPVRRDAATAGKGHTVIHHQQLAVGAVVQPPQLRPVRRVELVDLDAGRAHTLGQAFVHLCAADTIEQHMHLDTLACAFGQGIGELLRDITRPVDVGFEGDAAARAADRGQHRREDLVAVEQGGDAVAIEEGRAEQQAQFAGEGRVGQCMHALDAPLDLAFAAASDIHDPQPHQPRQQQQASQP
jgi:hypothetical protein